MGVPSSAASYAAGQDMAPAALRSAGLPAKLIAAGLEVRDEGTCLFRYGNLTESTRWPRTPPRHRVAAPARARPVLARGDFALVLGGNCTVALGVVAALRHLEADAPGLLYVDRHYDINTPDSTTDGALDWMGLAHALALPGCVDVLADAFGPRPLLEPYQVAWLGVQPQRATDWEREQAARLGLHVATGQALAADPAGAAAAALDRLPAGPLAVHIDVDVLDFTDALWRKIPAAAIPGRPSAKPNRPSRWPRAIHGQERCRSASSTRLAAPATPMRFPALPTASPGYSPSQATDNLHTWLTPGPAELRALPRHILMHQMPCSLVS